MTKVELVAELGKMGVKADLNSTKDELEKMYAKATEKAQKSGEESPEKGDLKKDEVMPAKAKTSAPEETVTLSKADFAKMAIDLVRGNTFRYGGEGGRRILMGMLGATNIQQINEKYEDLRETFINLPGAMK